MGNDRIYLGFDRNKMIFDPNGKTINKYEQTTIKAMIEWRAHQDDLQRSIVENVIKNIFEIEKIVDLKASAFNDAVEFLANRTPVN